MKIEGIIWSGVGETVRNAEPHGCRLLYVIGQLGIGGAERQLYYLLANLDCAIYNPCLVAWNYNPHEKYYRDIEALKIPIYGLPAGWSPLAKLRAFRKVVRMYHPEVIHSYGFHTNFAAYYAARRTGALAIGSLRSDFANIKRVGGRVRGALNSRWPHYHISNSAVCAQNARRHSSFFMPRRYIVVRNGVDLDSFRPSEYATETGACVASVGSLSPVKRWDRLMEAVNKVLNLGYKDVRFRLAGDGPLRPVLEQLIRELGVSHAVELVGAVYDIPAFLQGAKFLVHTSDSEGCPNAVMEAMAAGKPVVATDVGDIPYLVQDGKTGFVVRRDDSEALVNRIVTLWTEPDLCRQMGKNARIRAEQEFGLSLLVSRTLDAYRIAGWNEGRYPRLIKEERGKLELFF